MSKDSLSWESILTILQAKSIIRYTVYLMLCSGLISKQKLKSLFTILEKANIAAYPALTCTFTDQKRFLIKHYTIFYGNMHVKLVCWISKPKPNAEGMKVGG
jgi:hypothetical protein